MSQPDPLSELSPLLGESRSLPELGDLALSPAYSGGYNLSRSNGSSRRLGNPTMGRASGRKKIQESRRTSNNTDYQGHRLRMKYYNACRNYARMEEQASEENFISQLRSHNAHEAVIVDEEEIELAEDEFLVCPAHVLPPGLFSFHLPILRTPDSSGKQSSFVTILSIWNTMMGTSLLSVPWAMSQSGLATGLGISLVMTIIATFTACAIIKIHARESKQIYIPEFAQMCGTMLGKFYEYVGSIFSLLAVAGAAIVYWVLMSNFAYNTITYIYDRATGLDHVPGESAQGGVYCPSHPDVHSFKVERNNSVYEPSVFDDYWNSMTVPCYLTIVIVPLISIRSVTFFTKFNSLGTVTVFFLLGVVSYYSYTWGINVNFNDVSKSNYIPMYRNSFCSLSGMLALGLFIHNAIITIVANNKYQENNTRDTIVAFFLVIFTYMFIGIAFYITFPLPKSCIEDNFLNNFHLNDTLTVVCRALIFFQLVTVFPLIMYILRNQAFILTIGSQREKFYHICMVNAVVLVACICFACFYPSVGTIIRFSGAICGFAIVFFLPCVVYLKYLKKENRMSWYSIVISLFIILLGIANVVAQFLFV